MSGPPADLPEGKRTTLGLFPSARQAYDKWLADPEKVVLIDVRTPDECLFVGHPPMAWKIPVAAQLYERDAAKKQYPMKPTPDFVARVQSEARPEATILVMCRSGGRSAIAANMLAAAGFKDVHNIVDGMEGDVVAEQDSVFRGQRVKNGRKNSGCPWAYQLTPERMLLPMAA